MADFIIPCETVVRLSNIITDAPEGFKLIRIENGIAIATNRRIMALDASARGQGCIDIALDNALLEQCRKEVAYASSLIIDFNETLNYAVVKTTLGYLHQGSCLTTASPDFGKWREIIEKCREPAKASQGGMVWNVDMIARLAASSPSGTIVFEQIIDAATGRPTLMRDITEYDWLGVFQPYSIEASYAPASLPTWIVAP